LGGDDVVVLSSNPIPGNEVAVARMMNRLLGLGAEVVHAGQLHTSGHGKRDELATLHTAASPEWFVPVHGEYRHMLAHADLAVAAGTAAERVLVARDGDQVELADGGLVLRRGVTPGDYWLAHGKIVGVDKGFLRERRWLGEEGVVAVSVAVGAGGKPSRRRVSVEVASRGWLDEPERGEIEQLVAKAVKTALAEDPARLEDLEKAHHLVRKTAGKCIKDTTKRRPVIVPTITQI